MRTTKVKAAQVMLGILDILHDEIDGQWEDVSDELLASMVALRAIAQEYQGGDPRGRKSKVERARAARLVGGEQELFRA